MYFRISRYATLSLQDRVIVFGSNAWSSSPKIGVYKSGSWSSIGQLKHPRSYYGAVEQNGMAMIIGGSGTR